VTPYTLRAGQNAEKVVRYTNTLLVSLNNRIYFREHLLPEHGDSAFLTAPDRVQRGTVLTPLRFAVPEPHQAASKSDVIIISRPVDSNNSKGDNTITDSYLVRAMSLYLSRLLSILTFGRWFGFAIKRPPSRCHLHPRDPEWTVASTRFTSV